MPQATDEQLFGPFSIFGFFGQFVSQETRKEIRQKMYGNPDGVLSIDWSDRQKQIARQALADDPDTTIADALNPLKNRDMFDILTDSLVPYKDQSLAPVGDVVDPEKNGDF